MPTMQSLPRVFGRLAMLGMCLHHSLVGAIALDISNVESIKSVTSTIAHGMMSYYKGNETGQIPGLLPGPYYWWEAGAMFGQLIEYWYYTGDATYNDIVTQALLFQVGPNDDYMPPNQTKSEGNDDQTFWAFATLSAAELKFPDPPADKPQWLALAQAVFNQQVNRWDTTTCGGGLRWQIFPFNNGYDYKNTISNGGFFQLAARLARYTGNATYTDWATKMWDWMAAGPLLVDRGASFEVNDGSSSLKNCSDADHMQWTYNYGTFIAGAAYMYNYTEEPIWHTRLLKLLNGTAVFFPTDVAGTANGLIMSEVSCEANQKCNYDQPSFKAYLARWLATAMQLAPDTTSWIWPRLQASARGAAAQCSGGPDGTTCGRRWYQDSWDGTSGVGEQMSALSVIQALTILTKPAPVDGDSGGTSPGNPGAGTGAGVQSDDPFFVQGPSRREKTGAAVVTVVMVVFMGVGGWFMVS